MPPRSPPDLDALLRHADWVHALAHRLCADGHAADDAVQEAWAAAIARPPQHADNLRGWLGRLVRNFAAMRARSELRRHAREALPPPVDATEAAADTVARAELHRHLVALVLQLDEPGRGLILRHYFEGEDVAALARRAGTSPDAIRGQLRRARAALRARLQASDGPARRGLALIMSEAATGFAPGVLMAMTMQVKVTLLAAAAAAAAAVAWLSWSLALPAAPLPNRDAAVVAAAATPRSQPLPPSLARTATDSDNASDTDDAPAREVRCRLVGLVPGVPWTADFTVTITGTDLGGRARKRVQPEIDPDAEGQFTVRLPVWAERGSSFAASFEAPVGELYRPIHCEVPAAASAASELLRADPFTIPVEAVAVLVGTVVDEQGAPVRIAKICCCAYRAGEDASVLGETYAVDGHFALQTPPDVELALIAVGADQVNRFTDIPGPTIGSHWLVGHKLDDALLPSWLLVTAPLGHRTEVPPIVMRTPALLTGTVTFGDGAPVCGARFHATARNVALQLDVAPDSTLTLLANGAAMIADDATTDRTGRFRFAAPPQTPLDYEVSRAVDTMLAPKVRGTVSAPAVLAITFPGTRARIRVTAKGTPVADAWVGVDAPRPDAKFTDAEGDAWVLRTDAAPLPLTVRVEGREPVHATLPGDQPADVPFVVAMPDLALATVRLDVHAETPVREVWWQCDRLDGEMKALRRAGSRTDDAPFEFAVPPGRFQLQLRPLSKARMDSFLVPVQRDIDVPAAGVQVDVEMHRGGRIHVLARDAAGAGLHGAVHVIAAAGELSPWFNAGPDQPRAGALNESGSCETQNLLPGCYEVVVDLGAHGMHRRTVDVKVGEVAEVRIAPR
jgi:RNA polymerase sigma-70 factor (ECF subfamily)